MQIRKPNVFKIILLGVLALILIFAIARPQTKVIDITTTAKEYAVDTPFYQKDRNVKISGTYKKSAISDGRFDGYIDVEDVQGFNPETDTVHLAFGGNIATPIIRCPSGYLRSSEIHSVVLDRNFQYAIIILFNKFQVRDSHISASFDSRTAKFICVGDITRKQAIEILKQWYSLD